MYVGRLLRGYRAWSADWDGSTPVLRPLHKARTSPWQPGLNTARCYGDQVHPEGWRLASPHHIVPEKKCHCGFWAYLDAWGYDRINLDMNPYSSTAVTGVIRAEGEVQLSDSGFRTAKAEILAIAPPRDIHHSLRDVQNPSPRMEALRYLEGIRVHLHHDGYCPCLWCRRSRKKPFPPSLAELAKYYGVPWFDTFDEMCAEFPPTDRPNPMSMDQLWYNLGRRAEVDLPSEQPYLWPQPSRDQLRDLGKQINKIITDLSQRHGDSPAPPAFSGSSGDVVRKWWRWRLTKSTSDILE